MSYFPAWTFCRLVQRKQGNSGAAHPVEQHSLAMPALTQPGRLAQDLLRIPYNGLMCMQAAEKAGINAYTWQAFLDLGRKAPSPPHPPKPDDLCTIMYTSGTTGDPKVLQLLRRQLVSLPRITGALKAPCALTDKSDVQGMWTKPAAASLLCCSAEVVLRSDRAASVLPCSAET